MIERLHTIRVNQIGRRADRRAFTLVELLIVIVVIAILSSMVIMALSTASASAKDVHTRATITKLHDLIMQKYESYQTRRVPKPAYPPPPALQPSRLTIALDRLNRLRDLIRMEMPDRFTDFTYDNDTAAGTISNSTKNSSLTGLTMPSVTKRYQNRYFNSGRDNQYQSAECLYMIIAYGLQDQEALERFSESEIGDVDGDGLPEFIDAWGKPISFLRWAPAFPSEVQMPGLTTAVPSAAFRTALATNHHDPFDPLKQDVIAYVIYPLIYSAGPDRIFDIDTQPDSGATFGRVTSNNVFAGTAFNVGQQTDLPSDSLPANGTDDWHDNITNHDLLVP